jgi:hypothetical protein
VALKLGVPVRLEGVHALLYVIGRKQLPERLTFQQEARRATRVTAFVEDPLGRI